MTAMPGTSAASAELPAGTITRGSPAAAAAATAGSTPRTERSCPSRPSSPAKAVRPPAATGAVPAAVRMATAMARSKLGPVLGQAGGGERHRDGVGRPRLAAVEDRGADPVPGLAQRPGGQAGQQQPGRAVPGTGVDLDAVTLGAGERHGVRAGRRHQATPRTCSMVKPPAGSGAEMTRSIRTSSNRTPLAISQRTARRRSLRALLRLITGPSAGVPARRCLTWHTTSTRRSAATMSILPSVQVQSWARIRRPLRSR